MLITGCVCFCFKSSRKTSAVFINLPLFSSALANHSSISCLCALVYSEYFTSMTSYRKCPLATAFFHSENFKIRHAVLRAAKGSFFVTFYDCILTFCTGRHYLFTHSSTDEHVDVFVCFFCVCKHAGTQRTILMGFLWGSPTFFFQDRVSD